MASLEEEVGEELQAFFGQASRHEITREALQKFTKLLVGDYVRLFASVLERGRFEMTRPDPAADSFGADGEQLPELIEAVLARSFLCIKILSALLDLFYFCSAAS